MPVAPAVHSGCSWVLHGLYRRSGPPQFMPRFMPRRYPLRNASVGPAGPRLGSERQGKVGGLPYTDGMSGERDELARLVQEIPDAEIPAVLAEVRRRLTPAVERPWPPAFFGSIRSGRTDTARRVDEALAEGFGRS